MAKMGLSLWLPLTAAALAGVAGACGSDPVYLLPTPQAIEVNSPAGMGPTTSSVQIPFRLETQDEAAERQELAASLGLMPEQVPQARRDDFELSIEWTVKNLEDTPALARLAVLGANELYRYDPLLFVIDPDEEEPPPPLLGGEPIEVPPRGVVSGVFREDELAEAAQDLDAIARGGIVPEYALLTRWGRKPVTGGMGGELSTIPPEAVPALLQIDVSIEGNTHLVLEYAVRVRDRSGRLVAPDTDPALLVPPSQTPAMPPMPLMP